jgi:hypothetical protein
MKTDGLKPTEKVALLGATAGFIATCVAVAYGRASDKERQSMDRVSERIINPQKKEIESGEGSSEGSLTA